jgi:hypothetical protein
VEEAQVPFFPDTLPFAWKVKHPLRYYAGRDCYITLVAIGSDGSFSDRILQNQLWGRAIQTYWKILWKDEQN